MYWSFDVLDAMLNPAFSARYVPNALFALASPSCLNAPKIALPDQELPLHVRISPHRRKQ